MPTVIIPPTDVSPNTGTGSEVLSTSPNLLTPTLSVGAVTTALTDLLINPTTKVSGNLIDAQVNSVSKFSVTSAGAGTFGGNLTVSGNTNTFGSGTVDTDVIVNGGAIGSYSSALKYRSAGTEYWKVGRGAATGGANFEWYDYQGTPGTRFTIASSTGNATLSGNLTVSGTGTSSFAGPLLIAGAPSSSVANLSLPNALGATVNQAYFGDATRGMGMRSLQDGSNTAAAWFGFATPSFSTFNEVLRMTQNAAGTGGVVAITGNLQIGGVPNTAPSTIDRYSSVNVTNVADFPAFLLSVADGTKNIRGSMYIDASTTEEQWAWDFSYSSASFPQYKWKIAGTTLATLRENGNFILSSTGTDNGNGKLQLATHSTSAGGIGFGTADSFYTAGVGDFRFKTTSAEAAVTLLSGGAYIGSVTAGKSTFIVSGSGTTALTLDSSLNATFAGNVTAIKAGTAFYSIESTVNGALSEVIVKGKNSVGTAREARLGLNKYADDVFSIYDGTTERFRLGLTNGDATFAGNIKTAAPSGGTAATWRLGTVATVSPTSPNRTIEVEIGGTTYYIHAKTTND